MNWYADEHYASDHVVVVHEARRPTEPVAEIDTYFARGYVAKGEVEEELLTHAFRLSDVEKTRVEKLLEEEIIQGILLTVNPGNDNWYDYSPIEGMLRLKAPEEVLLRIQTMIEDGRTFREILFGDDRYVIDVVSVVSPQFLEDNPESAGRLGGTNFREIRSFLASGESSYNLSGRKCWYNREIGTVTIVDKEEAVYRAWEYMNSLPYIPGHYLY
jgi:hypothetical protein